MAGTAAYYLKVQLRVLLYLLVGALAAAPASAIARGEIYAALKIPLLLGGVLVALGGLLFVAGKLAERFSKPDETR